MKSIYDYLNYREFIGDRIENLRESNPNFSYRYFNMKSGLKSSGHLKLIIDGERNLSKRTMYSVCRGLGLSDKEAHFFESLVSFNQADTHEEKDHYYKKLIESYPKKHAKVLESKHFKVYTHWYYVAILELIRLDSFRENARWISSQLKPNVPASHIREALRDLELAGLIIRNEEGKLVRSEKMISTPEAVQSVALINFHNQMATLSGIALKKDPVKDKEYSGLTIAVSKNKFDLLKEKIQEFRKDVHALLEEEEDSKEEVVHMGIQLFKLTNGGKK